MNYKELKKIEIHLDLQNKTLMKIAKWKAQDHDAIDGLWF